MWPFLLRSNTGGYFRFHCVIQIFHRKGIGFFSKANDSSNISYTLLIRYFRIFNENALLDFFYIDSYLPEKYERIID